MISLPHYESNKRVSISIPVPLQTNQPITFRPQALIEAINNSSQNQSGNLPNTDPYEL